MTKDNVNGTKRKSRDDDEDLDAEKSKKVKFADGTKDNELAAKQAKAEAIRAKLHASMPKKVTKYVNVLGKYEVQAADQQINRALENEKVATENVAKVDEKVTTEKAAEVDEKVTSD